ncbi:uncharacterized protein LOC141757649 [Sebastes fasciatus]|uniref:uncharacterized protein LOC141757649 n=1 Tax=Sebastes fasciatus TaxID=394691 RepID=UPI003D9E85A4
MFVVNLVFWALLASSTVQSGIPRYIQGQWVLPEENPQYEDTDGPFLVVEERIWPQSPPEVVEPVKERIWPQSPPEVIELVMVEEQNLLSTPEPFAMKEQDPDGEGEESAVWKIVLVVAILLVSIVGSLSVAYYMCVWRGGRIHYKPQKMDYT